MNMATRGEIFGSMLNEFPQPTRPLHVASETNYDSYSAEDRMQYQNFPGCKENWTSVSREGRFIYDTKDCDDDHDHEDFMQILRGFMEELDEGRHEMFKKLVTKVKKDVPIKKIFKETLQEFGTSPISEVFENFLKKLNLKAEENDPIVAQRGVVDGVSTEQRLERFKVKTVNIAGVGVVKEDKS